MNTGIRKGHKSVFLKIFITFLLVITPLYFLNVFFSFLSRDSIRKEIEESTKSKINFYMDGIEKEFDGIMLMQQSIMNDAELVKIGADNVFLEQYEKNRSLLNIQKRLITIKNLSSYIVDVSIYVPLIGKKITTSAISELNAEKADEFEKITSTGIYPFYEYKNGIYINLVPGSRVTINGKQGPDFTISIEISKMLLEEMLKKISAYKQSGAVLVSNGNGINADGGPKKDISELKAFITGRSQDMNNTETVTLRMGGQKFIVVYKESKLLDTILAVYIPENQLFRTLSLYSIWIWMITFMAVIIVVLFAFRVQHMVTEPLKKLIGAFDRLDEGDTDISVSYKSDDEFGHLYKHFNDMVKRFGALIRQVYEEKIRTKDAELKQLQYQINPHFLYNTVYIIYRMSKSGNIDGIARLALHMGDYYKFVSRNVSDDVFLDMEVNHTRDYVGIQSFRFSSRITVEFDDLPKDCEKKLVPRLILQPVIENAYKYGLEEKETNGRLKIYFRNENETFSAFIEDNGDMINAAGLMELRELLGHNSNNMINTGMVNVHRRLQMKFGEKSGLFLSIGELGGLCVEVRIVFQEEDIHV